MKSPKKLIFPACGLLAFLLITFSPLFVIGWSHLRYGSFINYRGRSVRMPLRWYGQLKGDYIRLSKLSPTVFAKSPASALVSYFPVEKPPKTEAERDAAYQSFGSAYWTYLAGGTGETTGPFRKGTGEREAVCMKTSVIKDKWVAVSCLVLQGTWDATFYGKPEDVDSFFQIIQDSR